MGTRTSYDAGRIGLVTECSFPACDRDPVTDRGMCDLHQRVAISDTGSWLEAS